MSSNRKSFFSPKNMVVHQGNLSLIPLGTWLSLVEQLKPFFILGIFFHPFHLWMKNIIQVKV